MNTEEIIALCKTAGLTIYHGAQDRVLWEGTIVDALGRFAKLVAAAEREACARMFEEDSTLDGQDRWELAELIRARGEE